MDCHHMPLESMTPEQREALCLAIPQWCNAGFASVPIATDGSKAPTIKWKSIANGAALPPTPEDLIALVRQGRCEGIAVLMGAASGNAEMIELEGRAMARLSELEQHAEAVGIGDLFRRLREGCVERTPSGGLHFYLRVSDGPVASNTVFARRPGRERPEVLAETRGHGGYSICAPSGGRTHETGRVYELVAGSPASTPVFTAAEVEDLHNLFRILDEMPVVQPTREAGPPSRAAAGDARGGNLSPGDDFNASATWEQLLTGWTKVSEVTDTDGSRKAYWRRPGKDTGTSATVLGDGNWLYNFSSSVPLPTGQAMSKWAVFTHLHHGCDFSAAAADLARQGYGQRRSGTTGSVSRVSMSYRPFPVDQLPSQLQEFVQAGAAETGCDPAYIALPALAALASAIGNTRRLKLKSTWRVPPILWAALVGESGNQKTTGFQLAIKPLQRRQKVALDRYETERLQYEARLEQWEREKKRGPRFGAADRPEKPTPPVAERVIVGDTTIEALAPLLKSNPRGLLAARDELSGWLGSFDRYAGSTRGKSDAAHWLSMYNGASILVDRKTAQAGPIYVPQASVCVTGGIQPGVLRRALGAEHRESGLAARLLMAFPPRRPKIWSEAEMRPEVELGYAGIFDRLFSLQQTSAGENDHQPVEMELTPQARAAYVAYYEAHNREAAQLSGDMASAWSKLEETAARLALIIELARWAGSGQNHPPAYVDARSMNAAVVLADWFKYETRRIYAEVLTDDSDRKPTGRERLLEWLGRHREPVTARQVQQGCRFLREPGQAEAALDELAAAGEGDWIEPQAGQRGQPARRFRLSG